MKRIYGFIKEETFLFILIILFIFLTALMPGYMQHYHEFIGWKTIVLLLSLIMVATGIKQSGYLDKLARHLLSGIKDERVLAGFMAGLSALLSMFLTNDITLFIVVPVTVAMQKVLKNDLVKVVIFEAVAVNVGSTLTPIGNPQNIFIWNGWGISFASFMVKMALPSAVMAAALFLFIFFTVKPRALHFNMEHGGIKQDKKLGLVSFALMACFLVSLQFKAGAYALPVIAAVYFIFYKKVLADVDWLLILTFIIMFIDFSLLAKVPFMISLVSLFNMNNPKDVYLASALVSQFISNVPAAIFMSKFSGNWQAIAYGVDLAGNGTVVGSLANIIALRLLNSKKQGLLLEFHKYSIPFFILTALVVWLVVV